MHESPILDTKIGAAAKLLRFPDGTVIKPGALCTVLGTQDNGLEMKIVKVVFSDGVVRFVKPEDLVYES